MDINTRKSNSLKHIVYCHPPGFLATQQLVTDPHAENASCIKKKSDLWENGSKKQATKKINCFVVFVVWLLDEWWSQPTGGKGGKAEISKNVTYTYLSQTGGPNWPGEGGWGGNKQNRHIHFLVTNRGANWPFRCLDSEISPSALSL